MTIQIAPSILAADFARLREEVDSVLQAGVSWIHVDVMDGHFVPNITMGDNVVSALNRQFDCHLDVHLMVEQPERQIDSFLRSGANSISAHVEATPHVHRVLQQIRSGGVMAGLAFNPATPSTALLHCLDVLDFVLIMTVNPGFGGQRFLQGMADKVRMTRTLLDQHGGSHIPIQVDGGITRETIGLVVSAGAQICVAGSAVFGEPSYADAIRVLKDAAEERQ